MHPDLQPSATSASLAQSSYVVESMRDPAEWDAFVESAPSATFSHLADWQPVFADVMRHATSYLTARGADGRLAGILPLVEFRSALFGDRLISVPYLNDGGPLGERAAVDVLVAAARALTARRSAPLELRCRQPLTGHDAATRKVTVLLDLPAEAQTMWSSLPSKLRSQVRRPQKAGLTTRFGAEQLPAFYRVWSRNMRDLGTPVLPRRFFEAAAAAFPERFMVGCVYRDETPIAAGAGFLFHDEFEITWASALREHNRDAPNMLLYWSFMEHVIERGATRFNFGRCTPGEGTHRFKLQWGGESVPLPWIVDPASTADASAPGRVTRVASAAWQRLPVALTNAIGPAVARQLPWW